MFIAAAAAGLSLDQEEVKRDLGKSALTDAVRPFMAPQDGVRFSAMTGQSLFYMGETDLAHKVVAVVEEEEEEGAGRAAYRHPTDLLQRSCQASWGRWPLYGKGSRRLPHLRLEPQAVMVAFLPPLFRRAESSRTSATSRADLVTGSTRCARG